MDYKKPLFNSWPALLLLAASAVWLTASPSPAQQPPSTAEPGAPKGGAEFIGAARLYNLDRVTLVYPQSDGSKRDRNRTSAERRAAFLRSYGVEAEVVGDLEISEAQKQSHLVVLGWDNRLLTEAPDQPVAKDVGGRLAFGGIRVPLEDDLLFSYRSPFDPERYFIFWSRIDPERDRFYPLPFIGSDWVVYQDFRPMQQGMFQATPSWPPETDRGAQNARKPRSAAVVLGREGRIRLNGPEGELSDAEIQAILEARTAALERAVQELGDPGPDFLIDLFVYTDDTIKREQTGVPEPFHTLGRNRSMHITRALARSKNPAGEVALVAHALFGPSVCTSLRDGLPYAILDRYRGNDLDYYAAMFVDADAVPSLSTLLDEEGFRGLNDDLAPTAAGLLAAWLRERAKANGSFGEVYAEPDPGLDSLGRALDLPAKTLEPEFAAYITRRAKRGQAELAFRKVMEEASEHRLIGDYDEMATTLERALTLRPEDPRARYDLAGAYLRLERYEDAKRILKALMEEASDPTQLAFSTYQLGVVSDLSGDRESAEIRYRAVLSGPDRRGVHELARRGLERPFTRDDLD